MSFLDELPPPSERPPRVAYVLRAIGFGAMGFVVVATLTTEPRPALHGDGLGVLAALVLLVAGVLASYGRRALPRGSRFAGLVVVALGGALLELWQPRGASVGAVYFVFAIATMRLRDRPGLALSLFALGAQAVAIAIASDKAADDLLTLFLSTVPWLFVMRLLRALRERADELRESRDAHADAAAVAERARLARDMHDVLAHSLSALALQLEATRLLARDRGSDPDVVEAVERAHRLAAGGLDEARRAISALRGEELPGPERLQALADAFEEHSTARCRVTVTGTPRELDASARLALYRTAQEALTNVRRHSAADRVEIRLDYAARGTALTVRDHGPGAPVAVGGRPAGSGYGLTGMRERAELAGGELTAGPTDDGFEVRLWLPA